MSGIYQIYNPINNKRYIGSSINVERRLKEHLRNLEKNRHSNNHLQEDMTISLNPDYYLEGTANHEISHLADALVNKAHSADATNNYMEYLLDRDNIMSYNEIRQSLMDVNPNTYRYLTTPSENKAHMIQLKRGMQKEGLINNRTDPITQDKIEEYLSYRSKYANRVNPVLRTLYDIRPDKQGFINRMNNLTPIEWAVPLGLPMFFGEEQENK